MGPDKKLAHQRADEVCDGILHLLEAAYDIKTPGLPAFKTDHCIAKDQLREALRELFWIEACDSF